MQRRFVSLICITAVALILAPLASGQKPSSIKVVSSTGTLTGEVFDHHGTPLAGTAVTVTNTDKQLSQQTTTDAQGAFRVDALVPGEYELTYEAKNFSVLKQKTKIKAGKTSKVHAHLKYIEPGS